MNTSMPRETGFVTTDDAAEMLDVTARRVRQFIDEGRLPAQKIGRQWIIKREDVLSFAVLQRNVGRPAGAETASTVPLPEREEAA